MLPDLTWNTPFGWLLSVGLVVLLAGLAWLPKGPVRILTYAFVLLPVLIHVCRYWREWVARICNPPTLFFMLFLLWSVICTLWPQSAVSTKNQFINVVLLLLFWAAITLFVNRPQQLQRVVTIAFFMVAGGALVALLFNFFELGERLLRYRGVRLSNIGIDGWSDFRNPVVAGIFFGFWLSLGFGLWLSKARGLWYHALFISALLVVAAYLFLTYTRTAWVSAIVAGFASAVICGDRRYIKAVAAVGLVLVAASVMFYERLSFEVFTKGLSYRDQAWDVAMQKIAAAPLFGHGAEAEFGGVILNRIVLDHPHNLYLNIWYQYGAVGLGLLVLMFLTSLRSIWQMRHLPLARPLMSGLIFILCAAMADVERFIDKPGFYWVFVLFPVFAVIALSLNNSRDLRGSGVSEGKTV